MALGSGVPRADRKLTSVTDVLLTDVTSRSMTSKRDVGKVDVCLGNICTLPHRKLQPLISHLGHEPHPAGRALISGLSPNSLGCL